MPSAALLCCMGAIEPLQTEPVRQPGLLLLGWHRRTSGAVRQRHPHCLSAQHHNRGRAAHSFTHEFMFHSRSTHDFTHQWNTHHLASNIGTRRYHCVTACSVMRVSNTAPHKMSCSPCLLCQLGPCICCHQWAQHLSVQFS
jgi:hypothetical protein